MLYISLVLIFLGILIFLYSIMLDARKRREMPPHPVAETEDSAPAASEAKPAVKQAPAQLRRKAAAAGGPTQEERGSRSPLGSSGPVVFADEPRPRRTERPVPSAVPGPEPGLPAVLYEDSSRVIDYANDSGSIDPSLEKYRKIRRLGSGRVAMEKDGISFYMGKKMYRYDFGRIRDLRSGDKHMALFVGGSESVKLFIFETGSASINAIGDAYRDYVRRSS